MGYVVHGVAKESEMTSQLNGNTNQKKKKNRLNRHRKQTYGYQRGKRV